MKGLTPNYLSNLHNLFYFSFLKDYSSSMRGVY